MLRNRIERIAAAAIVGRETLEIDRPAALQALVSIEHDGREVLRQMREIVGTLDHGAPSEPQPSLEELPELLARTTSADTRLSVVGERRRLPAGIELAGYRIAEHLVSALDDAPGATVDVRLRFAPDALELHVSGRPAAGVDPAGILAAARERAALHNGTLDQRASAGRCETTARIPLVSSHAMTPPFASAESRHRRPATRPRTRAGARRPDVRLTVEALDSRGWTVPIVVVCVAARSPYGIGGRWRPPAAQPRACSSSARSGRRTRLRVRSTC